MERVTRKQFWKDMNGATVEKEAELANTYEMPLSPSDSRKNDKRLDKTPILKTASADSSAGIDAALREAFGLVEEEEKVAEEGFASLRPTIDVTGLEAPVTFIAKTAQHYALPHLNKYPLDTYAQVKTAASYFDQWQHVMQPDMRREYCVNLVKRASALDISLSTLAESYGSEKYAAEEVIRIAQDARRSVLHSQEDIELLQKVAEVQPTMLPEEYASVLAEFDRRTGLYEFYGSDVPDPYLSTFYKEAAQESDTDPKDAILLGNEYLPKRDLILFAKMGRDAVKARFGEEFADSFTSDPMGIFSSLPRDQKMVILRMASAVHAKNQSSSVS